MGESFVIWGSSGHAKVLAELLRLRGDRLVALFDKQDVMPAVPGVPLYVGQNGFERWRAQTGPVPGLQGAVAIGHCTPARLDILALFRSHGIAVPALVHPQASVCSNARLGAGVQVLAQAVVSAEAAIGEATIVNHRASVDHECVIGTAVHLTPGVTLCGCVTVGNSVFIGAGAIVLPRVRIGDHAIIAAGAVVTQDVSAGTTVAGVPARPLRKRQS